MTSTEPTRWEDDDAELVPAVIEDRAGEVVALAERARNYVRSSKAPNTLRAYESDLRHFGRWCERRALEAFPAEPETVALYLVDHAEPLSGFSSRPTRQGRQPELPDQGETAERPGCTGPGAHATLGQSLSRSPNRRR